MLENFPALSVRQAYQEIEASFSTDHNLQREEVGKDKYVER